MLLYPDIILHYWRGGEIPEWRQDCTNRLREIYPAAKFISDVAAGKNGSTESETFRFEMCATHKRCLWVDNDIELLRELPLTELPAMAHEYHGPHMALMWSGDNPEAFFGGRESQWRFKHYVRSGRGELIEPAGNFAHYATDNNGARCLRKY